MKEEYGNNLVKKYMKQIYAFVSGRVSHSQDVEDLTQEICLNLYKAATKKDILAEESFVWTAVKHTLANYYRAKERNHYLIGMDELDFEPTDNRELTLDEVIRREDCMQIQKEIAYLNQVQRKIVIAYYYEEKKQTEIASELGIPLGTVKWHLNVAKNELRKGMEKMRNIETLKFNPVKFSIVGLSGSDGNMGMPINFFRSALSQNIVYCISQKEMTVEEIADAMAVSPVYVESELAFLEEYSLVIKNKDKYISNILVEEDNAETVSRHKAFYEKVSQKMATQLYDAIIEGGYLDSEELIIPDNDKNFFMWALMFYLLAWVESDGVSKKITFDEVAELRADGGKNIITAVVDTTATTVYMKESKMDVFCGPCWNSNDEVVLWLVDGDWTANRVGQNYGGPNIKRDLKLLKHFYDKEELSADEYAFLCQKGYIKKSAEGFGFAIAVISEGETKKQLFELTKQIKNQVLEEFTTEIETYKHWVMENTNCPKHLKKQKEFGLQSVFHADGWFMLYAKKALEESGRLKPIKEAQKIGASEILIVN